MRDDRSNYVVVGCFVLAMLAALILWLAVLSGRTGAMESYYVTYANVMGLDSGTQVLYEGYPVGRIEDISRQDEGFQVHLRVRKDWPIPEGSVAAITASGLLSAVVIDIEEGVSSRALAPGGELASRESANAFAAITEVAAQVGDLTRNTLKPLLMSMSEDTPEIISSLTRFSRDLNQTLARVDRLLGEENIDRVERILVNADTMVETLSGSSSDLVRAGERLDHVLGRVDSMLEASHGPLESALLDLQHALASVARHIDAVNRNLEGTAQNMNEFSRQIRENPSVLLRGRSVPDRTVAAE